MPTLLPMDEPPKRKFFNNITATKNHTRHFMTNGIYDNKIPRSSSPAKTNNWLNTLPMRSSHHVSLSDNAKFMACCFMWYFSSSLSSNTGKQIMNVFKYPVTLTWIQFFFVASWCAIMENLVKRTGIKKPTHTIVKTIVPLSLFMTVGHVFSSISISRIPVSLVHTIKALAPLFTVLFYRFIFQVKYSSKVYAALVPLTTGVILACSFTFSNNVVGLACALGSCLIFVMQNIFSKKLLFKESKMGEKNPNKLDKMNMMFYSASIAFLLMIPLWFYSDGYRFLFQETQCDISETRLFFYFFLNGCTHFAQSWFAFTTLQISSPVTYSIASLVKRIFVIVMSIIWFGQQVSVVQALGIMLTFVGLWMYQKAKREVDQGETKAQEQSIEVLPTTNVDHDEHIEMNSFNDTANSVKKWIDNHLPGSNAAARQVKLL